MTFNELRLAVAIVESDIGGRDPQTRESRLKVAIHVMQSFVRIFDTTYFPYTHDEVMDVATKLRKNTDTRVKAAVARQHGCRCFWVGRNVGDCSEEAECGHLVPNCKGGPLSVANCVIECRTHNNERREQTIEEYLKSKGACLK